MKIFGIDPGTRVVGFGVIDMSARQPRLVAADALKTAATLPVEERLRRLAASLRSALLEYRPDVVVIEKAFYGRNVKSLIRLGEGRGVALLCAAEFQLEIHEYSPAEIKKAVTGNGGARKEQVAEMIRSLIAVPLDLPLDATDALAVALCHAHRRGVAAAVSSTIAPGVLAALGKRGRSRRGRGR